MPANKVFIIGGAQTDFALHWHRAGKGIADILRASFDLALDECQIALDEIQSAHIGNFVGELFCGQGQLGGLLVHLYPQLAGIPTARHEAACASGSMAILAGMREIEAGCYDLVAVSGVEMMRNVDGQKASEYLGAAAWVGEEAVSAKYPWVSLFSDIKVHYQERFGLDEAHLAAIAQINYRNAQRNPNAQTRCWDLPEGYFGTNDEENPIVEGTLRKSDCGRISDGSATVFLASETFARSYAQQRHIPFQSIPYIKGWGHRTAPLPLEVKLRESSQHAYPFPHLSGAISDAFQRANLPGAHELDAIETHDCFTISEYVALEHFGLTPPGAAWKVIEDYSIDFTGSLPVNPSGGLIGSGHPVGATGVRMLLDAYRQVAGKAEDYQVEDAQNVGLLNIGGSFTTVASFVIGRA
ncbi:MAG: acetyl-CoA acetyltransferase [Bacteroidota bacterium]